MKKSYSDFHNRLAKLGFKSYTDYLQSRHWQEFKKRCWREKKYRRCYICHKTGKLTLHHVRYENLGREKLNDVVFLCDGCHKKVHETGSLFYSVRRLREKKKQRKLWFFFG